MESAAWIRRYGLCCALLLFSSLEEREMRKKTLLVLCYLMPLNAFLWLVGIYPMIHNVQLSLSRIIPVSGELEFVALRNFANFLGDSRFWESARLSVMFLASYALVTTLLGMGIAWILNKDIRLKGFYMVVLFLPWIIPEIVAAITTRWLFNPQIGVMQGLLRELGVRTDVAVLSDPGGAMGVIVLAHVWRFIGFSTLIILGGLQSIPSGVTESARLDGASGWSYFKYVYFPLMRSVLLVTILLLTIFGINSVAIFLATTDGGPLRATEVLSLYMYKEAFRYFHLGPAAALAFLILVVNVVLIVTYIRILKSEVVY